MSERFLPFHVPDIGREELCSVSKTLQSGWLTSGPRVSEFEAAFASACGARYALAVNSCTAGLHLAMAALGIGRGAEVITTPLTFCATVNTILHLGADPVLVDVGPDLNIDEDRIAAFITPNTRAILPVHLAGLPCELDAVRRLARQHHLHVVEDAAHAAGAMYKGTVIGGSDSDATVFSFYATKNLTTGEGGMITTGSADLEDRMRSLSLHGISRDAWNRYGEKANWYYEVLQCGFKYNMSDIMAAIGLVQLRKLDRMNARRSYVAARYRLAFREMEEIELPPDRADCRHAWHLYVLRLNLDRLNIHRAQFIEEMRRRGIGCSVHFIPIPLHPYYRRALRMRDACPRALAEYPRLVSLPLYSKMTDEDVERVVSAVREILGRHRKRQAISVPAQTHVAEGVPEAGC